MTHKTDKPLYNRDDLIAFANGHPEKIFGADFTYVKQLKFRICLPERRLQLVDRVISITPAPMSKGLGEIVTETDITQDAWYLINKQSCTSMFLEIGQADLILLSWLGYDQLTKGERVYRLLGMAFEMQGPLPNLGDTLRLHTKLIEKTKLGDIDFFKFEQRCYINDELRFVVSERQVGLFTYKQLAESKGITQDLSKLTCDETLPAQLPKYATQQKSFDREKILACQLQQFVDCFGETHRLLMAQTRPPNIYGGAFPQLQQIEIDFNAGQWQRGYAKALQTVSPNDWWFSCHFTRDPCLPGSLMMETGLELMRFYMLASGLTILHDGWRFMVARNQLFHPICRAQITPQTKQVMCELQVEGIKIDPIPELHGHIILTADGKPALYARLVLQLVPDGLLSKDDPLLYLQKSIAAKGKSDVSLQEILANGQGLPHEMYGGVYANVADDYPLAHLPQYPYCFISRLLYSENVKAGKANQSRIIGQYDIPIDAWYFADNDARVLPYAILMEITLQLCGWLSGICGYCYRDGVKLKYRNLEGAGTLHREILPAKNSTIETDVLLTSLVVAGEITLFEFKVVATYNNEPFYDYTTKFGFFPERAFNDQPGLSVAAHEKNLFNLTSDQAIELKNWAERPYLASANLLMIDNITGFWPKGGVHNKGAIRTNKKIDPAQWMFKAHFYQDPVQPGSLGIQAFLQTLQCYQLLQQHHKAFKNPRFQSLLIGHKHEWKYRGQVVPNDNEIVILADIVEETVTAELASIIAELSYWIDGKKIYSATLGMSIIENTIPENVSLQTFQDNQGHFCDQFSLTRYPHYQDHAPNYLQPTVPLTVILDRTAIAAQLQRPQQKIVALDNVFVFGWAIPRNDFNVRAQLDTVDENTTRVKLFDEVQNKLFAQGKVTAAENYKKAPFTYPEHGINIDDYQCVPQPYAELFHGKAFQLISKLYRKPKQAYAIVKAHTPWAEQGLFNPILLDAIVQGLPNGELYTWDDRIPELAISYPYKIEHIEFYQATPTLGQVEVLINMQEYNPTTRTATFEIQAFYNKQPWLKMLYVTFLISLPMLHTLDHRAIREFLSGRVYSDTIYLVAGDYPRVTLDQKNVKKSEFIPGMFANVYDIKGDFAQQCLQIAVKELFSRYYRVHPSFVSIANEHQVEINISDAKILRQYSVSVEGDIITAIAIDQE